MNTLTTCSQRGEIQERMLNELQTWLLSLMVSLMKIIKRQGRSRHYRFNASLLILLQRLVGSRRYSGSFVGHRLAVLDSRWYNLYVESTCVCPIGTCLCWGDLYENTDSRRCSLFFISHTCCNLLHQNDEMPGLWVHWVLESTNIISPTYFLWLNHKWFKLSMRTSSPFISAPIRHEEFWLFGWSLTMGRKQISLLCELFIWLKRGLNQNYIRYVCHFMSPQISV